MSSCRCRAARTGSSSAASRTRATCAAPSPRRAGAPGRRSRQPPRPHAGGQRAVGGGSPGRVLWRLFGRIEQALHELASSMVARRRGVPLSTVAPRVGPDRRRRFRRPPAHVALLRGPVVDRRGWIDAREFADADAACQLAAGPRLDAAGRSSARSASRGLRGALAGGLAFILPGAAGHPRALAAVSLGSRPAGAGSRRREPGGGRGRRRGRRPGRARLARASLAGRDRAATARALGASPGSARPRRSRSARSSSWRWSAAAWPSCRCAVAAAAPPCTPGRSRFRSHPAALPPCPRSRGRR